MHLVVVHYHYRPGGVRRVVELGLHALLSHRPGTWDSVTLAGGEAPETAWWEALRAQHPEVHWQLAVDPALGYTAESRLTAVERRRRLRRFWSELFRPFPDGSAVVWLHNPGLGRNLFLVRELLQAGARRGFRIIAHHHDWWFEHRWQRWAELRRHGARSLAQVAGVVFATHPAVRHAVINRRDASVLGRYLGRQVGWLPNLVQPVRSTPETRVQTARQWLRNHPLIRGRPVWIVPCRLLRRKNLAEALLLTRWLRPEGCLLTTGGPSSEEEIPYARALTEAARRHQWPVALGALAEGGPDSPDVLALMRASEAVLLTSIQEGFGLPYLEAAAVGRPLIARRLPAVVPDLRSMGFTFPQMYDDVRIPAGCLDWAAERRRLQRGFDRWRRALPRALRRHPALQPWWELEPGHVAFSSLTLEGQLEVLRLPAEESRAACAALNPWLEEWRQRAGRGQLVVTPWPASAQRWMSPAAYARRFLRLLRRRPAPPPADAARKVQEAMLEKTLAAALRHPLLWAPSP